MSANCDHVRSHVRGHSYNCGRSSDRDSGRSRNSYHDLCQPVGRLHVVDAQDVLTSWWVTRQYV